MVETLKEKKTVLCTWKLHEHISIDYTRVNHSDNYIAYLIQTKILYKYNLFILKFYPVKNESGGVLVITTPTSILLVIRAS